MRIQYDNNGLVIFESSLFRTTTTLIIGADYLLLIDPNWLPIEIEFIERQIELRGKDKEKFLLFTHSDYDHIIGYGKFKGYKTIASQNFIENKGIASVLKQIEKFDDENYILRDYEIEYPRIDISLAEDKQSIQIGEDTYQIFQARGHNKDCIITYNKTKEIVIAGDYLSNIEFPYIYDSWQNYMDTLAIFDNLIENNSINTLVTGHGDYTCHKNEMKIRILESRSYLIRLKDSVIRNQVFEESELLDRYEFPIIMKQFHEKNVQLVTRELLPNSNF